MAYGTPTDRGAIGEFYTDVRRGHPPTTAELDNLIARYDAIGGTSPMNARTTAQVAALQVALDALEPGRFRTYYGSKHADPKIEATIARAASEGSDAGVGDAQARLGLQRRGSMPHRLLQRAQCQRLQRSR